MNKLKFDFFKLNSINKYLHAGKRKNTLLAGLGHHLVTTTDIEKMGLVENWNPEIVIWS